MTHETPEREALVKALEIVVSASRPLFSWSPSEGGNAAEWLRALATVRNGFGEITKALAPAVTATEANSVNSWQGHQGAASGYHRESERDAVLEEAARVADAYAANAKTLPRKWATEDVAISIRALKSTTPQTGSQE